jgi:hypothetical protein
MFLKLQIGSKWQYRWLIFLWQSHCTRVYWKFLQEVCPAFRINSSRRRTLVKCRQSTFTRLTFGRNKRIHFFQPSLSFIPQLFEVDFKMIFMFDLFQYLHELNLRLQDRQNTVCDLQQQKIIYAFQNKLDRFLATVNKNKCSHFPELKHTVTELRLVIMPPNYGHVSSRSHSWVQWAVYFLKKYSVFSSAFNPLKFTMDQLNEVPAYRNRAFGRYRMRTNKTCCYRWRLSVYMKMKA